MESINRAPRTRNISRHLVLLGAITLLALPPAAAETANRAKFRECGDAGAYVTDVEAKGVGCGLARKVAVGREGWIYEARSHRPRIRAVPENGERGRIVRFRTS